jgi:hypothetical protein
MSMIMGMAIWCIIASSLSVWRLCFVFIRVIALEYKSHLWGGLDWHVTEAKPVGKDLFGLIPGVCTNNQYSRAIPMVFRPIINFNPSENPIRSEEDRSCVRWRRINTQANASGLICMNDGCCLFVGAYFLLCLKDGMSMILWVWSRGWRIWCIIASSLSV